MEVEGRCAGWLPDPSAPFGAVVGLDDCRLLSPAKKWAPGGLPPALPAHLKAAVLATAP